MYLIIQKSDGKIFAYFEDKKHFKASDLERKNLTRLKATVFYGECDLSEYGDNIYMVIPVKKKKVLKMRSK